MFFSFCNIAESNKGTHMRTIGGSLLAVAERLGNAGVKITG